MRHSLRPGVPIIILHGAGWRQIDTKTCSIEREDAAALALIDNCDKNVADEK